VLFPSGSRAPLRSGSSLMGRWRRVAFEELFPLPLDYAEDEPSSRTAQALDSEVDTSRMKSWQIHHFSGCPVRIGEGPACGRLGHRCVHAARSARTPAVRCDSRGEAPLPPQCRRRSGGAGDSALCVF